MTYKEVSAEENSVVNDHCSHLLLKFVVNVKDRKDKLPTMYWLPKLLKNTQSKIYCQLNLEYY